MKSALCLLLALFLTAGLCPSASPQAGVVLPDVTYKRLLNDLQVSVAHTPHLGDRMTMGLLLRYGSSYDPAGKAGLAALAADLFAKETLDRSAKDIQGELAFLDASLEVKADWDGIRFILNVPGAGYERALLLLYQAVCEARFDEDDLEKAREARLAKLALPADPRQRVRERFEIEMFRGTSYGRPMEGTPATLRNITIGDIRHFHDRFFSPGDAFLTVVGPVPADALIPKATRIWGVWVRKDSIPFTFLPPRKPAARNVFLEDDPSSPAAQFVMGNLWPQREERAYYAGALAAAVLEERLTKALPTSLLTVTGEGRRMSGPFTIQGQAAADQALAEIRKILEVAEVLKESGPTREELEAARQRWLAKFALDLKSTEGICRRMLDSELYRLGTNYLVSFEDLLRRSDQDAVKQALKDWIFPGGLVLLVSGPSGTIKTELETLGPVSLIAP